MSYTICFRTNFHHQWFKRYVFINFKHIQQILYELQCIWFCCTNNSKYVFVFFFVFFWLRNWTSVMSLWCIFIYFCKNIVSRDDFCVSTVELINYFSHFIYHWYMMHIKLFSILPTRISIISCSYYIIYVVFCVDETEH